MQKLNMYSIKDNKAGDYQTPFFQGTDVHALRLFRAEVNRANDQNLIYLYPDEYELHRVGSFNLETGKVEPDSQRLATGSGVKNKD